MHDEGRDHRGRNAIQQWKREADTKFQYVLEPLDARAIAALIFANLRGTVGEAQRSHPWSNVCDA